MKTTLEIPDDLFRRAKRLALQRGTSLRAIVTQALERELGPDTATVPPIRTHTYLPPGAEPGSVSHEELMSAIKRFRYGIDEDDRS